MLRDRDLVENDLDAFGRWATTPPWEPCRLAVDQQRPAPHPVRLVTHERVFEACSPERARPTDRLRASDVEVLVGEEEVGERAGTVGASCSTDERDERRGRVVVVVVDAARGVRFGEHAVNVRTAREPSVIRGAVTVAHRPNTAIVPAWRGNANYHRLLMGRLCERPGCSENAALTYGMRPEDLVFWIDLLREGASTEVGVLCLRHGDTMTVPRGWTLDDLRDPDLHLFRPPPRPDGPATRRTRSRRRANDDDTGQLALGDLIAQIDELDDPGALDAGDQAGHVGDAESASPMPIESSDPTETAEAVPPPTDAVDVDEPERPVELNWKPAFDDGDDLDGLLAAQSPLLARAFRGERG